MRLTLNFQRELDNIFKIAKEEVVIKSITIERNSEGDITENITTQTTYGVVFPLTDELNSQNFGSLEVGDCVLVLKPGASINEKDRVLINNIEYEIEKIVQVRLKGTELFKEVYLKKYG